jgi:FlaA1/EpsC-like NDP-sugar epimerase
MFSTKKHLLVLMDFSILILSLLIFSGSFGAVLLVTWSSVITSALLITALVLTYMVLLRTTSSLWQYASPSDYLCLMMSYAFGFITFYMANKLLLHLRVSYIFLIAAVAVASLASIFIRFTLKSFYPSARLRSGGRRIPEKTALQ